MTTDTTTRRIILSAEQVRAALDGRLREVWVPMDNQPPDDADEVFAWFIPLESRDKGAKWAQEGCYARTPRGLSFIEESPFGPPGTELWCAEEWRFTPNGHKDGCGNEYCGAVEYRDGGVKDMPIEKLIAGLAIRGEQRWRSADTMSQWASRLTLRTLSSEPRQVQTVTEAEAKAFGVQREYVCQGGFDPDGFHPPGAYGYVSGVHAFPKGRIYQRAVEAFAEAWDAVHPSHPFASNPWAWRAVVETKGASDGNDT